MHCIGWTNNETSPWGRTYVWQKRQAEMAHLIGDANQAQLALDATTGEASADTVVRDTTLAIRLQLLLTPISIEE